MIEITVREAVIAFPALEALANHDLPQKASWRIGRMIDKLRPVLDRYGKHRNEIIKKHGEPNKDGVHEVKKRPEALEAFEKEHDELFEQKEKVDYDPIPLSLFKRREKDKDGNEREVEIELNGAHLGRCMKFFSE